MKLGIREAIEQDLGFLVANNLAMAFETEVKRLDRGRLERGVGRVLRDRSLGFYLIAEEEREGEKKREREPVGQLLLTFEWSDWRDGLFWWIQSVYVRPQWRRRGVYASLYREVLERAKASGDVCGVRLYVESTNEVAREVYGYLGMTETSYRLMEKVL